MTLLQTVIAFLVALAVLVVVHELGHYWVARWCGVKVLRFSVGFGRALLMSHEPPARDEDLHREDQQRHGVEDGRLHRSGQPEADAVEEDHADQRMGEITGKRHSAHR